MTKDSEGARNVVKWQSRLCYKIWNLIDIILLFVQLMKNQLIQECVHPMLLRNLQSSVRTFNGNIIQPYAYHSFYACQPFHTFQVLLCWFQIQCMINKHHLKTLCNSHTKNSYIHVKRFHLFNSPSGHIYKTWIWTSQLLTMKCMVVVKEQAVNYDSPSGGTCI